jgi:hypothetical protein
MKYLGYLLLSIATPIILLYGALRLVLRGSRHD